MLTKKYFSISEASKMSGIAAHRLRYIEKSDPNVEIVKIRERRYYTKDNIDYIKNTYQSNEVEPDLPTEIAIVPEKEKSESIIGLNAEIISQIDQLIIKFSNLTDRIRGDYLQN